jgi:hypothetical protein
MYYSEARLKLFWFDRKVDESGVSGTGRVAQGVEFDDGVCVLRWLTTNRSTAIYSNIQELEKIHSHGGQTKIVWESSDDLVDIPKPHLALGAEGPEAEVIAMSHGIGPALSNVRQAYDRIRSIKAPRGWEAYACFYVGGEVCLRLTSPSRLLYQDDRWQHYTRFHVELMITAEKTELAYPPISEAPGGNVHVLVDGIAYPAKAEGYARLVQT